MKPRKCKDILNYFKGRKIEWDYLKDHCKRYEFLLYKIDSLISKLKSKKNQIRILDIGPSFQTEILRLTLPDVIVDSIGFQDSRFKIRPQDKHFQYNLNDAQYKIKWLKIKKYDIIIMAELIEHLYTSPKLVLECVKTWLKNEGYLIIQTPNAVSLNRRLKMIIGRHPYDMIRETHLNPGHFREYTTRELISIGKISGLILNDFTVSNYFRHSGMTGNIYNILCGFLPTTLRDGMTICFQKK